MKPTVEVRSGDVFGRLTIAQVRAETRNKASYHLCKCSCGNEKFVAHSNLVRGLTTSCGCYAKEVTSKRARSHGMSKTPEYATWSRMWRRCTCPSVDRYPQYGGRGITVCDQWKRFENFYSDIGPKPSSLHSIGRIDNDGNYEPGNCRWELPEQQHSNTSTNRFIEHEGQRKTLAQWARHYGMCEDRLRQRHRAGLTPPEVFFESRLTDIPITVDGVTRLTTEWMREAKIPISSFYYHQRKGLSREEVVRKYLQKALQNSINNLV